MSWWPWLRTSGTRSAADWQRCWEGGEVSKNWEIAELQGLWWAYKGELPPPEAFQTHGRPRHLPILGPYPSRVIAEALLRKQPDRRDPGTRRPPN
jgi:hypothetical protein